jgi:hypothetical protein
VQLVLQQRRLLVKRVVMPAMAPALIIILIILVCVCVIQTHAAEVN